MIKHILAAVFAATFLASCQQFSKPEPPKSGAFYGEKFDTGHAVSTAMVLGQANAGGAVVSGTITQSCQSEGCWVKLDGGEGRELFVSTEDNFTVPKEGMKGLRVYVKGETYVDTTEAKQTEVGMKATGLAIK